MVGFKHPYTGDTAAHAVCGSLCPKKKQVSFSYSQEISHLTYLFKVLDLLIRKGAPLNEKNKDFLTPLHIAADNSHYDLMDVLLRNGAKV